MKTFFSYCSAIALVLLVVLPGCDVTQFMPSESSDATYKITSVLFRAEDNDGLLDEDIRGLILDDEIYVTAPYDVIVDNIPLVPSITTSSGAIASPDDYLEISASSSIRLLSPSGEPVRTYTLNPSISPASTAISAGPRIQSFVLDPEDNEILDEPITGFVTANTILVPLPEDMYYSRLSFTPSITLSQADASVSPADAQDFTQGINYTVTKGGQSTTYGVIAVVDGSTLSGPRDQESSAIIRSFRVSRSSNSDARSLTEDAIGTVDHRGVVSIALPHDLLEPGVRLEPDISIPSGAAVTPQGPQDFSSGVNYTIVSADGRVVNTYVVQPTVNSSTIESVATDGPQANILMFELPQALNPELPSDIRAVVDNQNRSIILPLPSELVHNSIALEPEITLSPGASITPSGPRNFSDGETYVVVSSDGGLNRSYQVSVAVDKDTATFDSAAGVTDFVFEQSINSQRLRRDFPGVVSGTTIYVGVPSEIIDRDLQLIPTITTSPGASVSPSSVPVRVTQEPQFTVTSGDGGESVTYTIKASIDPLAMTRLGFSNFFYRHNFMAQYPDEADLRRDDNQFIVDLPPEIYEDHRFNRVGFDDAVLPYNASLVSEPFVFPGETAPYDVEVVGGDGITSQRYQVALNRLIGTRTDITSVTATARPRYSRQRRRTYDSGSWSTPTFSSTRYFTRDRDGASTTIHNNRKNRRMLTNASWYASSPKGRLFPASLSYFNPYDTYQFIRGLTSIGGYYAIAPTVYTVHSYTISELWDTTIPGSFFTNLTSPITPPTASNPAFFTDITTRQFLMSAVYTRGQRWAHWFVEPVHTLKEPWATPDASWDYDDALGFINESYIFSFTPWGQMGSSASFGSNTNENPFLTADFNDILADQEARHAANADISYSDSNIGSATTILGPSSISGAGTVDGTTIRVTAVTSPSRDSEVLSSTEHTDSQSSYIALGVRYLHYGWRLEDSPLFQTGVDLYDIGLATRTRTTVETDEYRFTPRVARTTELVITSARFSVISNVSFSHAAVTDHSVSGNVLTISVNPNVSPPTGVVGTFTVSAENGDATHYSVRLD